MIPTEVDSNQFQCIDANANTFTSATAPTTFDHNESRSYKPQLAFEMYLKLLQIAKARNQQINPKDVLLAAYTGRNLMYNNNSGNTNNCNNNNNGIINIHL